jgi:hypothetical protein
LTKPDKINGESTEYSTNGSTGQREKAPAEPVCLKMKAGNMLRYFIMLTMSLILTTVSFATGVQVDCTQLDPRPSVSTEKEGKIQASVNTLYKIAKAGGSVEGRVKKEIQNLQQGAPMTEQGQIKLRTLYLFCGMVANAKDLSTERKVELYKVMVDVQSKDDSKNKGPGQKKKTKVGSTSSQAVSSSPSPKSDPLFPKLVDNNVEFPAIILERTTPGFKPGDKFYIALHENGWNPKEGDQLYEMERKGDKLIAKHVISKRFHPVLVPRIWHKIELAYDRYLPRSGEFNNNIDYTNPNGPCYCFGPQCVPYNQGGQ